MYALPYRLLLSTIMMLSTYCSFGQIYTAKNGIFIVLHPQTARGHETKLILEGRGIQNYDWPKNANEFMSRFRKAETDFGSPAPLADGHLIAVFSSFNESLRPTVTHAIHPSILIALGHAVYLPGISNITAGKVETTIEGQTKLATLAWIDHCDMGKQSLGIEQNEQDDINIQLKFVFPRDCWIDSARVYKKVLGSADSVLITPIVLTTQLSDRIEMHVRDTSQSVGEFIYILQPHDRLGLWHAPLKGVYAQNYTIASAPSFLDFKTVVATEGKHIRLSWLTTSPERVRGFEIYRAPSQEGPYQKVATLSERDTMYVDHVESTMQNFFYYIQILDHNGYGRKSTTHFVTPLSKERPLAPADPIAEAVKEGIKVSWSTTDAFYHIKGYYLYRRASEQEDWVQVSAFIPKTGDVLTYLDSSRELKTERQYAYAVRSESTSYILSDYSEIAYARPGLSRVVAVPENLSWKKLDQGQVLLYWNDLRTTDPYVVQYHIFELDSQDKVTREAPGSPIDASHTTWTHPEKNKAARGYVIVAEDAWGNTSAYSDPVRPERYDDATSPGILLMKPISTGYRLTWGPADPATVKAIQIFELTENNKPLLIKSVGNTLTSYDVPMLKKDQVKVYSINYKMNNGVESEMSQPIIIRG